MLKYPLPDSQFLANSMLQVSIKHLEFNVLSSNICATVKAYCSFLLQNVSVGKVSFFRCEEGNTVGGKKLSQAESAKKLCQMMQ